MLVNIFRDVWYNNGTIRASRNIHKLLLESILGSTMRYVDGPVTWGGEELTYLVGGWMRHPFRASSLA